MPLVSIGEFNNFYSSMPNKRLGDRMGEFFGEGLPWGEKYEFTEDDLGTTTEGVIHKPGGCKKCPYQGTGSGFCFDWWPPKEPKFAIVLDAPTGDEIIEQTPLVGKAGSFWEQKLLAPLGLGRDDLIVTNVLRCMPPKGAYPSGKLGFNAENNCRQYDAMIKKFAPDTFVMTYHPRDIFKEPAFLKLVRADLAKVNRFAEMGKKVCVLMGEHATSLLFQIPFKNSKGGMRAWRGHFWSGKWNF